MYCTAAPSCNHYDKGKCHAASMCNTGAVGDTFCQGKTGQFYADPCDCTKFAQCSNGITYLESCASGTVWSKASLGCVDGSCSAAPVTSSASPSTTLSPSPAAPITSSASPATVSPAVAVTAAASPSPVSTQTACPTGIDTVPFLLYDCVWLCPLACMGDRLCVHINFV
jgi:hypothetical protein